MFEIRLLFGENNMSGDEKSNKLSIYILLILIGFGIYIASLSFFPKPGSLVTFADDAYYYLQISRNIALGNGSTFDGIGKTNGYHPLWLNNDKQTLSLTIYRELNNINLVFL